MTAPVLFLTTVSSACKQQVCGAYLHTVDKLSGFALSQPKQNLLAHRKGFWSDLDVIILLCMNEAWLKWN